MRRVRSTFPSQLLQAVYLSFVIAVSSMFSASVQATECTGDCFIPRFTQTTTISTGAPKSHLATGDFNEDGNLDLVSSGGDVIVSRREFNGFPPGPAVIMFGDGLGGFGPPVSLFDYSSGLAVADFNYDSHLDLILKGVSVLGEHRVLLFYGNGDGSFDPPATVTGGDMNSDQYTQFAVADFDNDGYLDLATSDGQAVPVIQVYFGNGTAFRGEVYKAPESNTILNWKASIAVGDFYKDGALDLVHTMWNVPNSPDWDLTFWNVAGTVPGYFYMEYRPEIFPGTSLAVADFNSDGVDDLVASTAPGNLDGLGDKIQLYTYPQIKPESGPWEWVAGNSYSGGSYELRAGDLNVDGKADVVTLRGVMTGNGDGSLNALEPFLPSSATDNALNLHLADVNNDGKLDILLLHDNGSISVLANSTTQTSTGSDVSIEVNGAEFTFDEVTSGGTTTVTSIDPATAGDVPGGFALANVAFEVTTTATFTGEVTSCFTVSTVNVEADFLALRVLHNEGGTLVDRTSSHDFANRKICATTTSFSPFYLAKVGNSAEYLFDRSKAFKAGKTIPIKLKLVNSAGENISSSNLPLYVRGLRQIGTNTTSEVNDPGDSNPDYLFRFTGDQYQYNLKTTGLPAGRYVLSYYAGSDTTFFYTMEFEVR